MVHAPVGVRCEECAQIRKLPTFEVSGGYMARAIGVGITLAVVGGVLAGVLVRHITVGFADMLALAGVGYLIAEGVGLAVNRKRGRPLKFVAAGSMFVAYIAFSYFVPQATFSHLIGLGIGVYVAVNRF